MPKATKKKGATVAVWSPMMGGSEASMQYAMPVNAIDPKS